MKEQLKLGYKSKLFFFFYPADPRGITSREVDRDFQPSLTSSAGVARGCSDHRFRAPPAYTASQLLTLHQHRANNQYRTGLIKSSQIQGLAAKLEQSPIQVLTKLSVAWLQLSYENWYFQVDKPLHPWVEKYHSPKHSFHSQLVSS